MSCVSTIAPLETKCLRTGKVLHAIFLVTDYSQKMVSAARCLQHHVYALIQQNINNCKHLLFVLPDQHMKRCIAFIIGTADVSAIICKKPGQIHISVYAGSAAEKFLIFAT